MRLATFKRNFWQLRSGEACHRKVPKSFWIPELKDRENLKRGQSARLIFDIEADGENGEVLCQGERMWATVAERIGDIYIGILENQPACLEPAENVYLCMRAEIPFQAKHIIDIGNPPSEYVEWQLGQPPERVWPRE